MKTITGFILFLALCLMAVPVWASVKAYDVFSIQSSVPQIATDCSQGQTLCFDYYETPVGVELVYDVAAPNYGNATQRVWHRAAHLLVPGNNVGDRLDIKAG